MNTRHDLAASAVRPRIRLSGPPATNTSPRRARPAVNSQRQLRLKALPQLSYRVVDLGPRAFLLAIAQDPYDGRIVRHRLHALVPS